MPRAPSSHPGTCVRPGRLPIKSLTSDGLWTTRDRFFVSTELRVGRSNAKFLVSFSVSDEGSRYSLKAVQKVRLARVIAYRSVCSAARRGLKPSDRNAVTMSRCATCFRQIDRLIVSFQVWYVHFKNRIPRGSSSLTRENQLGGRVLFI